MKNRITFSVALLACLLTACGGKGSSVTPECQHDYELVLSDDNGWHTCIAGQDFDSTGIELNLVCKKCADKKAISEFETVNGEDLKIDQTTVTLKYEDYELNYSIVVKNEYHIACCGDSLTAGHYWANQSYPTYLSNKVDSCYKVGNFGVNGISITGYGGSWDDPSMCYIKQDVYQNSVDYKPDIFAIMLGTNDATGWAKAEPTFLEGYKELLDSYIELFPNAKFIMMVAPPTKTPNNFNIPNDTIKEKVNPIQRELADEYGFEVLDLREEFEETDDYESLYLRPNDGVHFTEAAADYVAGRVWDIAKNFRF